MSEEKNENESKNKNESKNESKNKNKNKNKNVFIPALIAIAGVMLLLAYHYYSLHSHRQAGPHLRQGDGEPGSALGGVGRRPSDNGESSLDGYFTTLGTIALYLGAAGFSWFWFKKKLKSPLLSVRKAGKLLHALHQPLGWATIAVIAVHGGYFLITKLHDDKVLTGLAGLAILLTLAAYGYFIKRVRGRWMRLIHRSLGMLWVPVLLLHAGGSSIAAAAACLGVGGLVWILERLAKQEKQPA